MASPDSPSSEGALELSGGSSTASSRAASSLPAWERDPIPLAGWTAEEQSVLLSTMRKCAPRARRDPEQRRNVYFRCATTSVSG